MRLQWRAQIVSDELTDCWKNVSKPGCHLALDRDLTDEDNVSTVGRITGQDALNFQSLNRIRQWKTVFGSRRSAALCSCAYWLNFKQISCI